MNKIATTSIKLENSRSEVWDALVNPEIVKKYFFGTEMVSSWKIGDYVYYRGVYDGTPYEDKGLITVFEPNTLLAYNYRSSWSQTEDIPENYLPVKFELKSEGEKTILNVVQECSSEKEAQDSTKNWIQVLKQMQEIIKK